jgi:hypothetical protein
MAVVTLATLLNPCNFDRWNTEFPQKVRYADNFSTLSSLWVSESLTDFWLKHLHTTWLAYFYKQ